MEIKKAIELAHLQGRCGAKKNIIFRWHFGSGKATRLADDFL